MNTFERGGTRSDLDSTAEHAAFAMDESASDFHMRRPGDGISGAELRRRLITPEALAAIDEEAPKKTLMQRLLRR